MRSKARVGLAVQGREAGVVGVKSAEERVEKMRSEGLGGGVDPVASNGRLRISSFTLGDLEANWGMRGGTCRDSSCEVQNIQKRSKGRSRGCSWETTAQIQEGLGMLQSMTITEMCQKQIKWASASVRHRLNAGYKEK